MTISDGRPVISYWAFVDNADAYGRSAAACTAQAGNRYSIQIHPVPSSYTDGYQLVSRELAARATDIDLYTVDSTWMAQFAQSGWLQKWNAEDSSMLINGNAKVAISNATFDKQVYAAPLTAQTEAIATPPGKAAPNSWNDGFNIESGDKAQTTGLISTLVAKSGGSLLGRSDKDAVALGDAAQILKAHADTNANSTAKLVNPTSYLRSPDSNVNVAWSKAPSASVVQQVNIGVVPFSQHRSLATEAAKCMTDATQQKANLQFAMFPTNLSAYDDPLAQDKFGPLLNVEKDQLQAGIAAPQDPNFAGVLIALEQAYLPFDSINLNGFGTRTQAALREASNRSVL